MSQSGFVGLYVLIRIVQFEYLFDGFSPFYIDSCECLG